MARQAQDCNRSFNFFEPLEMALTLEALQVVDAIARLAENPDVQGRGEEGAEPEKNGGRPDGRGLSPQPA